MATEHSDVAAELWALAETVLTRLEPVLRQAMEEQRDRPQQGCSWCPVCALSALIRGEQHDLLTLLASEGATVVALFRQIVAEHAGTPGTAAGSSADGHTAGGGEPKTPEARPGSDVGHEDGSTITSATEEPVVRKPGFVPITVTVKDSSTSDSVDEDN